MSDRRVDSTLRVGLGADDRGISEVVAFILTFAIILGSVGLLYTTAFGAMMDYQENEQETNAVRAMDSLTDNFNDVLRSNGVNQRYGELSLRDGRITTGNGGTALNISINGSDPIGTDGGDQRFAGYGDGVTAELGEFAYESDDDDDTIAYEGGGLVRGDETGSVVLREPRLRCNPEQNTAIISLVTVSAEDRSVQSSSGLGVSMTVENRSSRAYSNVNNVTIEREDDGAYEGAWNDILSGWTEDDGGCGDFGGDGRVVVTIVEVDIDY
ncbi:hypothetical protein Htur_0952 [Haloterrigena turkmenica DSM 5511]|uniref:Uncharacterized protein n=1 Tax=Haloterrigena turkmenica (strain ATCC 51198 / DSM 5511 / JCM 9101 / NCIMB 13204 / VKM B-1734 / 4k) TaxID=543526 RepID=D2RYE5_HALTV|nr:hypothetical protein [Haloterrigena turkmenica]ADB59846.1 hypothetical protein Htur_0952 [Haloterrigena turkmenica DSM 5511]